MARKMNALERTFTGITSANAQHLFHINVETDQSVQNYAKTVLDETITLKDAGRVRRACIIFHYETNNGLLTRDVAFRDNISHLCKTYNQRIEVFYNFALENFRKSLRSELNNFVISESE